jgi:phenylacetate-CoA ligase
MFIVKGVNVFPLSIQAVLLGLVPRVTGEFQVVIDRPPPIDYPVPLTIEVSRDVPAAQHGALAAEIGARIAAALNFKAAVALVEPGTIATEGKTRRVIRSYREEVG